MIFTAQLYSYAVLTGVKMARYFSKGNAIDILFSYSHDRFLRFRSNFIIEIFYNNDVERILSEEIEQAPSGCSFKVWSARYISSDSSILPSSRFEFANEIIKTIKLIQISQSISNLKDTVLYADF
jgi:hypothetical protein